MSNRLKSEQNSKTFTTGNTTGGVPDEEIKALFDLIDRDKSGSLSARVSFLFNGLILPHQEAKKACKLIKDRFGVEEASLGSLVEESSMYTITLNTYKCFFTTTKLLTKRNLS